MKRGLLLLVAACSVPDRLEPWQLDHDRVVAVRAEPPHIAPGEIAVLEALLAHADGPTTVAAPRNASAANAPAGLFTAVHFYFDYWRVDGPSEDRLAAARAELALPDGAPVPLEVTLELPGPLYARKTVWLGDRASNPPAPALSYGPELSLGEHALDYAAPSGGSVRWLTSCGRLERETSSSATHVIDESCDGELVLVVRDAVGGVAWSVLPIRAR